MLLSLSVPVIPLPALADYVVERGDVLEITVPGAPGLHRRVTVDAGGQLSVPLVGDLDASNVSLAQLRAKLRDLLITKNIVRNPEVTIEVAEYRPLYLSGDVEKPGAYPYRPGMTVRDAVALAGGYDLLRLRGRDPMVEAADARGEYETFAIALANQAARIARLKAELAGKTELELDNLGDIPVRPAVLAEIRQSEAQQLAADRGDGEREKAYLGRMIKAAQDQLAVLAHQQESGSQALEQQARNVARARELMQRGLLQAVRLEDEQRAATAAQNQIFEVAARAAQARRDLEDYTRKLQTADDQRRIRLLQELRDATAQAATARYRLEATGQKLRYAGAAQLRHTSAIPADPPDVAIHRQAAGVRQLIKADEDTKLLPGDNLEITTKADIAKLVTGSVPLDRPATGGAGTSPTLAMSAVATSAAPALGTASPDGNAPDPSAQGGAPNGQGEAAVGPSERTSSPAEIAVLLARGEALAGRGDIVSARRFYERAANAGNGKAAMRMAETFDPAVIGPGRPGGDASLAAAWYHRAGDLGEAEAMRRLNTLEPPAAAGTDARAH